MGSATIGQIESNYDEITDSFDSMNLKSELLRGNSCASRYQQVLALTLV